MRGYTIKSVGVDIYIYIYLYIFNFIIEQIKL